MKKLTCCICGEEISGYGNNPYGACWVNDDGTIEMLSFKPEERCCDRCNTLYVITGRIYRMSNKEK